MEPYKNVNTITAKGMVEAGIDIKLMIKFIDLTLTKSYGLASREYEILDRSKLGK